MESGPATGQQFGAFRLFEMIGRGGMGVVYRAEHQHLGRKVALKMLTPQLAADPAFRERFLRESRVAASVDHPGIVTVYDAGDVQGTLYIAMRFVEGTDLAELLRDHGALAPQQALSYLGQIASALDAAHAHQLVHRDVKPANVLIEADRAYLTDFGLTKAFAGATALTDAGQFLGTADYVAPEQIQGGQLDGRADVYALGAVLFECLTGSRPYPDRSGVALLYAHLHEPPPQPSAARSDLPAAFDAVVARAMAKHADERYATCGELIEAARKALGQGAPPTVPAAPVPGAAPPTVPAGMPSGATRKLARDPETAALPRTVPPPAGAPASGKRTRLLAAGALAIIAAVVAGLALLSGGGSDESKTSSPGSAQGTQSSSTGPHVQGAPIHVGSQPLGVTYAEGSVWTADNGDDSITRVSPEDGATKRIDAGGGPFGIGGARGTIYVVNSKDGTVDRIDARTGEPGQPLTVGSSPRFISVDARRAYIPNGDDDTVSEFYVPSGEPRRDPFPTGPAPRGIATAYGVAWVANSGDATVSRISHGVTTQHIGVGDEPNGVTASPDAVWVANTGSDSVSRIDPANPSSEPIETSVGAEPVAVAFGEGYVWVTNSGDDTVMRLDPASGKRVGDPIDVPGRPTGVTVGGGSVWVTARDRDELVRIEP